MQALHVQNHIHTAGSLTLLGLLLAQHCAFGTVHSVNNHSKNLTRNNHQWDTNECRKNAYDVIYRAMEE